ncbi:MFS transporter [Caldivirga maquilingensis]|uniref:Major facilitator superfamily MFS_1 n=1 Tax=Caldivirga maquilingensis (strain ATCC 700844 / DSM 13496 / JCM 10307 / IC-167) TaxID=397948 RepID=A8MB71_CALMQ|nr:MFS transporter [Caldivirga maquilingensis]ABW01161.1 major facilitator superfamily MFS_1 [Caldivirga maquilingensis IC-167]
MDKLRLYVLIQNLANGLTQPFMSFLAVASGVPNIGLGLISSANGFFAGVTQLPLRKLSEPVKLLKLSTASLIILWLLMAFISYTNPILYVVTYLSIAATGGVSSYAWALLLERASRGSRGRVLAEYGFFGSIGGLLATLTAGLVVRGNYALAKYVFITAALLIASNFTVVMRLDNVKYDGVNSSNLRQSIKGIENFLGATFIFAVVWSFAWPIFPVAQYYVFSMTTEQVAILSIVGGASTLILQRPVGSLVDKHRRIMMFLGRFLLITFPLMYVFSTSVYQLFIINVVSGFTNSVSNTAYMAYLFDNSRDKKSAITIYNAVYGTGTLVGSLIGSASLSAVELMVGVKEAVKYLLLIDAAARAGAAVAYLKLPEFKPASRGTLTVSARTN